MEISATNTFLERRDPTQRARQLLALAGGVDGPRPFDPPKILNSSSFSQITNGPVLEANNRNLGIRGQLLAPSMRNFVAEQPITIVTTDGTTVNRVFTARDKTNQKVRRESGHFSGSNQF